MVRLSPHTSGRFMERIYPTSNQKPVSSPAMDLRLANRRMRSSQATSLQKVGALAHAYRTLSHAEARQFVEGERAVLIPLATLRSKGLVERVLDRDDDRAYSDSLKPKVLGMANSLMKILRIVPFTPEYWQYNDKGQKTVQNIRESVTGYVQALSKLVIMEPSRDGKSVHVRIDTRARESLGADWVTEVQDRLVALLQNHPPLKRTGFQKAAMGVLITTAVGALLSGGVLGGALIADWTSSWSSFGRGLALNFSGLIGGISPLYALAGLLLLARRIFGDRLIAPPLYHNGRRNLAESSEKRRIFEWLKDGYNEVMSLCGEKLWVMNATVATCLALPTTMGWLGYKGFLWLEQLKGAAFAEFAMGAYSLLIFSPIFIFSMMSLLQGLMIRGVGGNRIPPDMVEPLAEAIAGAIRGSVPMREESPTPHSLRGSQRELPDTRQD